MRFLICILCVVPIILLSQSQKRKMALAEAFEEAARPNKDTAELLFENIEFTLAGIEGKATQFGTELGSIRAYLLEKSKFKKDFSLLGDSMVVLHRNLNFSNCIFPSFQIDNIKFKDISIVRSTLSQADFNNIRFNVLRFGNNEVELLIVNNAIGNSLNIFSARGESFYSFQNGVFKHVRIYNNDELSDHPSINFLGCKFQSDYLVDRHGLMKLTRMGSIMSDSLEKKYRSKYWFNQISFDAENINNTTLNFMGCAFENGAVQNSIAYFGGTPASLSFEKCRSDGLIWFSDCKPVTTKLQDNTFQYIDLGGLRFNKENAILSWSDMKGRKICKVNNQFFKDTLNTSTYLDLLDRVERELPMEYYLINQGNSINDLSYTNEYKEIYASYQNLYDYLKSKGDLESANECYIEMKDLLISRLDYLYHVNKSFNNYFRWKLAGLIRFYTNHGTDPARAITISMWVVLLFGVFYFFFPSDWDVTSKAKLISNYRLFIEKNEHGYVKPFFFLLGGFLVSLINALTLSLNSFTTLGFGNIPTHGLARYICVLEGFIGWFLLSIFTVALINQMLG